MPEVNDGRDPALDRRGRLAIVAGEDRLGSGRRHRGLHRNRRKGRGRDRHRRGYCLTLRGQQQHEADAGRRCDHRDSREPGRHSRRHVSERRPCRRHAEGPGRGQVVRSSALCPPSRAGRRSSCPHRASRVQRPVAPRQCLRVARCAPSSLASQRPAERARSRETIRMTCGMSLADWTADAVPPRLR
jgi:hypothetical protein